MTIASRPTVVIFCDHLLYLSETFIRAQGQALRQFSPVYAGSRRVAGLELPAGSCYTINSGNTPLRDFTPSIRLWFMRISVPMDCGRSRCHSSSVCRSS